MNKELSEVLRIRAKGSERMYGLGVGIETGTGYRSRIERNNRMGTTNQLAS